MHWLEVDKAVDHYATVAERGCCSPLICHCSETPEG